MQDELINEHASFKMGFILDCGCPNLGVQLENLRPMQSMGVAAFIGEE